jgi:hypothetical protein
VRIGVDGTGSELCPVVSFEMGNVKPSGSGRL